MMPSRTRVRLQLPLAFSANTTSEVRGWYSYCDKYQKVESSALERLRSCIRPISIISHASVHGQRGAWLGVLLMVDFELP